MDIDNISDIVVLRELSKRDRIQCIQSYNNNEIEFIKGQWYFGYGYYRGGVIVYQNEDRPCYKLHKIFSVEEAMKYFDLEYNS